MLKKTLATNDIHKWPFPLSPARVAISSRSLDWVLPRNANNPKVCFFVYTQLLDLLVVSSSIQAFEYLSSVADERFLSKLADEESTLYGTSAPLEITQQTAWGYRFKISRAGHERIYEPVLRGLVVGTIEVTRPVKLGENYVALVPREMSLLAVKVFSQLANAL